MQLKICDSHLTCKVSNKCLNVLERLGVVEWNKRWSPPFPCCPAICQFPWKKTLIEKKKLQELIKDGIYPTGYNLLIVQGLWQTLYQILVNNLSEGIYKIKYKYWHNDKKCVTCRIKWKYCGCFLEYTYFKDDLIEYKCLCCNRNYQ